MPDQKPASFFNRIHDDYMQFDGRINRMQFAIRFLTLFIINLLLFFVYAFAAKSELAMAVLILPAVCIGLILGLCDLFICIRRLHDLSLSGWLILLVILIKVLVAVLFDFDFEFPLINNTIEIIFLVILFFFPGSTGPNKYGMPPGYNDAGEEKDEDDY